MPGRSVAERYRFELRLLLDAMYWRSGTDLRHLSPQRVTTVIEALREEMGLQTLTALTERLVHNDHDVQRVLDALQICLSEPKPDVGGDALMIDHWRNHVVPLLRSTPFPSVWVHDCGDAALRAHLFAMLNECDLLQRCTVFVTCTETSTVALLRQQMQQALPMRAGQCCTNLIVAEYNIHTDGTFNEFDFILCGTVLRRLASATQRRVMRLLGESLTPCGVLQLLAPDAADAARIAPIFLPMDDGVPLYRHALLERHAQRRRHALR